MSAFGRRAIVFAMFILVLFPVWVAISTYSGNIKDEIKKSSPNKNIIDKNTSKIDKTCLALVISMVVVMLVIFYQVGC